MAPLPIPAGTHPRAVSRRAPLLHRAWCRSWRSPGEPHPPRRRSSCGPVCSCPGSCRRTALQRLARRALHYTPRVSLEPPDGLLLEVQGSLHLFAGVAGLRRALTEECRHLGVAFVLAFAPTPLAALALARAGRPHAVLDAAQLVGQLAALPLTTLRWPEEVLGRLGRAGCAPSARHCACRAPASPDVSAPRSSPRSMRSPGVPGICARPFGRACVSAAAASSSLSWRIIGRFSPRSRRSWPSSARSSRSANAASSSSSAGCGTGMRRRPCELQLAAPLAEARISRRCSGSAWNRSHCRSRCAARAAGRALVPQPPGAAAAVAARRARRRPRARRPASSSGCARGWERRRSMA